MRIAYDAGPILGRRTGIGHYAETLLKELLSVDEELEVDLFALTVQNNFSEVLAANRIRHRRIRVPGRLGTTVWTALGIPAGERLVGDVDVVHGTNFWIPPLSRPNGIVTIHDLSFWLYPEWCTPQIQRYRWMVPKVLKRCALVITPSETVCSQVAAELKFPEDRIVVTPEGVRGSFLDARPGPAVLERIGAAGDYVLFAGTQEPRKNLDRLIEAFAELGLPGLQLVIAGPPGWGSVDLPAVAHKLHVGDRVLFTGYMTDRELGSLMAEARAFAFPTLYEGFGLPPLEAMAAGIPVVAAHAGALPEVLGDAPFWCDPLDAGSISQAIRSAVTDGPARAGAIDRGRARASMYSWADTAKRTLEAYRLVAAKD